MSCAMWVPERRRTARRAAAPRRAAGSVTVEFSFSVLIFVTALFFVLELAEWQLVKIAGLQGPR